MSPLTCELSVGEVSAGAVWHSTNGEWRVEVRVGWSPTATTGTEYFQIKRYGALHAEVTTLEELARIVPLHELVEGEPG